MARPSIASISSFRTLFKTLNWRSSIFKKALTRPIWWWERHRPYSIRQEILRFEPKPIAIENGIKTIILTTPQNWIQSCWTLYSILLYFRLPLVPIIYVDGVLNEEIIKKIRTLFPGIQIQSVYSIAASLTPRLNELFQKNILMRKALMVDYEWNRGEILFCDDDALFFQSPDEIESLCLQKKAFHIGADEGIRSDAIFEKSLYDKGIYLEPHFNSGLFYLPVKNDVKISAENITNQFLLDPQSWFLEQTLIAAFHAMTGSTLLERAKYVSNCKRQFYFEDDVNYHKIIFRHFMGPVRHLMFARGIPHFKNLLKNRQLCEKN